MLIVVLAAGLALSSRGANAIAVSGDSAPGDVTLEHLRQRVLELRLEP